MGFMEEFKRAYAGDDTQHYKIGDKQVVCPHCGGEDFDLVNALLNTRGMTFLGLDFANRGASLLVCLGCSQILWFLEKPARV